MVKRKFAAKTGFAGVPSTLPADVKFHEPAAAPPNALQTQGPCEPVMVKLLMPRSHEHFKTCAALQ